MDRRPALAALKAITDSSANPLTMGKRPGKSRSRHTSGSGELSGPNTDVERTGLDQCLTAISCAISRQRFTLVLCEAHKITRIIDPAAEQRISVYN